MELFLFSCVKWFGASERGARKSKFKENITMKKFIALALALVLALGLVACGGNTTDTGAANTNTDTGAADPAFGADLTAFYANMQASAGELPMMMDLAADLEMLEMSYPGLKDIETKQLVAVAPMMSAVAMEFVFVEVANAADVETVKGMLQARIDAQVGGGAWYPETIAQWEQFSEIVVIDNFVCLFVHSDKDLLVDAFRNGTEIPAWAAVPAAPVDMFEFWFSVSDYYGENFPANMNLAEAPDMLEATYPGLSEIVTNQLYIYQPMMGAVVCEMALIEVADAADVEAVKAILQARIDAQVDGGAWYPESIEGWQNNSRIVENGNYIMMIAYENCDEIVGMFNDLF